MKVYLSGPMRGIERLNADKFARAARYLQSQGHDVFNPAETDPQCPLRRAMEADLTYICRTAEIVALLPGWERSLGAFAEWALARALGLHIMSLTDEEIGAGQY